MSTISVPISSDQEKFINDLVKSGKAANKAHAVRYAIQRLAEEEAIRAVRESEEDVRQGKVYRGDLRKLLKRIK